MLRAKELLSWVKEKWVQLKPLPTEARDLYGSESRKVPTDIVEDLVRFTHSLVV